MSSAFVPGHRLAGRYVIERELGRGAAAVVYLAVDERHDRRVAVKVLKREWASSLGESRFLREITIAARLQHPHIVPLFDSGELDDVPFYVMPYVAGESLRHRLLREKQLGTAEAVRIAREVASALAHAHAAGIVHRDIKPENIMLSDGLALVADFGIARSSVSAGGSPLTTTGIAVGTPAYMSPEQGAADRELDARSDIYSLGCVLYEMLAGQPPFSAPNTRALVALHLIQQPVPLQVFRPDIPAHVAGAVRRALAKAPADRFQTAARMAEALAASPRALGGAPLRATKANLGPGVSRMCDRWAQVNAFDACFRASQREQPGQPQFYVVHGDEGEGHESLVERIVATRLHHFAAEITGEERATVLGFRVPWPQAADLATRQRDLAIALFREIAPGYLGDFLSADALRREVATSLSPIIVIQHELRATSWDSDSEQLIAWYVNEFWRPSPSGRTPIVLVFLKVIYPQYRTTFSMKAMLGLGPPSKRAISERLGRLLAQRTARCAAMMFTELSPVTIDDVKQWFSQNEIYDSEQRRRQLADEIFAGLDARRMAEVEPALERVHRDFMMELSYQRGDTLWTS